MSRATQSSLVVVKTAARLTVCPNNRSHTLGETINNKTWCHSCRDWLTPEPASEAVGEKEALQWGIEDTGDHLWIGPMRHDGEKVNEIVARYDLKELTPEAEKRYRQLANIIVQAVNQAGPQSDAIRAVENQRDELRRQLAQLKRAREQDIAELAETTRMLEASDAQVEQLKREVMANEGIEDELKDTNRLLFEARAQIDEANAKWNSVLDKCVLMSHCDAFKSRLLAGPQRGLGDARGD